ncbi:MAG TPA: DUF4173 domain-containing protein [Gemmatimonadales bacterium]|nr:DUF4173 domain-containing protein [Gemmatimonadales bacterium]
MNALNAPDARAGPALEMLALGLALGVLGDVLLRAVPWGVNVFICSVGFVGAATWIVRRRHLVVSGDAPWLAVGALLLGSNFAARDSRALQAFDALGLMIVLGVAGLSLRGIALRHRYAWEYVRGGAATALGAGLGIWPLVTREIAWSALPAGRSRLEHARAVGVGALLALPLLLLFGALFASADTVFANVVTGMLDVDYGTLASHVVLIGFFGALAVGYFQTTLARPGSLGRGRSLAWPSLLAPGAPAGPDVSRPRLGIIPVATALGLLDLLFLLFVVVQLRYFFGGAALVEQTTNLTYAEYARRGFLELVTASALVLPVLLGADWVLRAEPGAHRRTFRHLAGVLLVLLAGVMASAFRRVGLYVDEFAWSEIRLYATAFMVYLLGVFGWFVWTVLRERRRRFAFGALVQGFAVLAGLHILNPDAFIARANLFRPAVHRPADAAYAASLSADAVPVVLAALPRLSEPERCRAARRLLGRWGSDAGRPEDGWRSWNLARARARRAVREAEAGLRALPCAVSS